MTEVIIQVSVIFLIKHLDPYFANQRIDLYLQMELQFYS